MLKKYRRRANLSQEELEKMTNIDRKTIFRIEHDICVPLLDTFSTLVKALHLSDEEIALEVKKVNERQKKLQV